MPLLTQLPRRALLGSSVAHPAAQVMPIPTAPRMRLSHFFITTSLCTWTFYHRCCRSGLTTPPSERRREQRACHSMWLEARDDGTDDSDGEHPIRCTRTPAERRSRQSPPTRHRPAGNPSATVRGARTTHARGGSSRRAH